MSSYPAGNGVGAILRTTDYRVAPSSSLGYNNVTMGIPLVILGSQGGLGLSYRRAARTGQAEETRAQLYVATSANQAVTYGRGDIPEGGLDAFTVSVARQMGGRLSVGANLNIAERHVQALRGAWGFALRVHHHVRRVRTSRRTSPAPTSIWAPAPISAG